MENALIQNNVDRGKFGKKYTKKKDKLDQKDRKLNIIGTGSLKNKIQTTEQMNMQTY